MREAPKAFISYAGDDRDSADRLIASLRAADVGVDVDRVNVGHGEHILSAMRAQLSATDFLVLLLSPRALESQWVQRELEYAVSTELRQRSITVVPFKVEPCKVPSYLARWSVIDATRDFSKATARLASLLRAAPQVNLDGLPPERFESLVGDLLRAYGFKNVRRALQSKDFGFDYSAQSVQRDPFGRAESVEWLVEVKALRRQADLNSLRAFVGALSLRRQRGLFVTSGTITSPARAWLEDVARSGGPQLVLLEGIEVKRLVMAKPRLVEQYFRDEKDR